MKTPNLKPSSGLRFTALATLLAFSFTSTGRAQPAASLSFAGKMAEPVVIPDSITIPQEFGSIQAQLRAPADKPFIFVIQDAHAILDAQTNIQKLIGYLQDRYGVDLVALEGGKGALDPTLFRTFPEELTKKKILGQYLERGELSGAEMAAVFNAKEAVYYGIEDWNLYEENYLAYLKTMQAKPGILKKLEALKGQFDEEREKTFAPKLNEFHKHVETFREETSDLVNLLKYLNENIVTGGGENLSAQYPHLSALLGSLKKDPSFHDESLDVSIRKLAESFKKSYLSRLDPKAQREFNSQFQDFLTGGADSGTFLKSLLNTAAGLGVKPRLTPLMKELLGQTETLSNIKGTKLFDELEQFLDQTEQKLVTRPEEKELVKKYKELRLLKDLANLELTREGWEKVKAYSIERRAEEQEEAADSLNAIRYTLSAAIAFYEVAEKRDRAFRENLGKLLKEKKARAAIVLAGGFHAQGFEASLKEMGFSYALISPKMASLEGQERYGEVMQGNLSYKKYLQTTFYDAFVKDSTLKLVSELSEPAFRKDLKIWRDEVIRKLANEGRVAEASRYTRYIDLLLKVYQDKFAETGGQNLRTKEEMLKAIEKELNQFRDDTVNRLWQRFEVQFKDFTQGLHDLIEKKSLTKENVSLLLDRVNQAKPFTLKPLTPAAALTPDLSVNGMRFELKELFLKGKQPLSIPFAKPEDVVGALIKEARSTAVTPIAVVDRLVRTQAIQRAGRAIVNAGELVRSVAPEARPEPVTTGAVNQLVAGVGAEARAELREASVNPQAVALAVAEAVRTQTTAEPDQRAEVRAASSIKGKTRPKPAGMKEENPSDPFVGYVYPQEDVRSEAFGAVRDFYTQLGEKKLAPSFRDLISPGLEGLVLAGRRNGDERARRSALALIGNLMKMIQDEKQSQALVLYPTEASKDRASELSVLERALGHLRSVLYSTKGLPESSGADTHARAEVRNAQSKLREEKRKQIIDFFNQDWENFLKEQEWSYVYSRNRWAWLWSAVRKFFGWKIQQRAGKISPQFSNFLQKLSNAGMIFNYDQTGFKKVPMRMIVHDTPVQMPSLKGLEEEWKSISEQIKKESGIQVDLELTNHFLYGFRQAIFRVYDILGNSYPLMIGHKSSKVVLLHSLNIWARDLGHTDTNKIDEGIKLTLNRIYETVLEKRNPVKKEEDPIGIQQWLYHRSRSGNISQLLYEAVESISIHEAAHQLQVIAYPQVKRIDLSTSRLWSSAALQDRTSESALHETFAFLAQIVFAKNSSEILANLFAHLQQPLVTPEADGYYFAAFYIVNGLLSRLGLDVIVEPKKIDSVHRDLLSKKFEELLSQSDDNIRVAARDLFVNTFGEIGSLEDMVEAIHHLPLQESTESFLSKLPSLPTATIRAEARVNVPGTTTTPRAEVRGAIAKTDSALLKPFSLKSNDEVGVFVTALRQYLGLQGSGKIPNLDDIDMAGIHLAVHIFLKEDDSVSRDHFYPSDFIWDENDKAMNDKQASAWFQSELIRLFGQFRDSEYFGEVSQKLTLDDVVIVPVMLEHTFDESGQALDTAGEWLKNLFKPKQVIRLPSLYFQLRRAEVRSVKVWFDDMEQIVVKLDDGQKIIGLGATDLANKLKNQGFNINPVGAMGLEVEQKDGTMKVIPGIGIEGALDELKDALENARRAEIRNAGKVPQRSLVRAGTQVALASLGYLLAAATLIGMPYTLAVLHLAPLVSLAVLVGGTTLTVIVLSLADHIGKPQPKRKMAAAPAPKLSPLKKIGESFKGIGSAIGGFFKNLAVSFARELRLPGFAERKETIAMAAAIVGGVIATAGIPFFFLFGMPVAAITFVIGSATAMIAALIGDHAGKMESAEVKDAEVKKGDSSEKTKRSLGPAKPASTKKPTAAATKKTSTVRKKFEDKKADKKPEVFDFPDPFDDAGKKTDEEPEFNFPLPGFDGAPAKKTLEEMAETTPDEEVSWREIARTSAGDFEEEAPTPSSEVTSGLEEIARHLRKLPSRERNVVRLYYLEGRSYEEISTELNIPINSIAAILDRVRKKLREMPSSESPRAATDAEKNTPPVSAKPKGRTGSGVDLPRDTDRKKTRAESATPKAPQDSAPAKPIQVKRQSRAEVRGKKPQAKDEPKWFEMKVEQGIDAEEVKEGLREIRFNLYEIKNKLSEHFEPDELEDWIDPDNFKDQVIDQYVEAVKNFNAVILNGPINARAFEKYFRSFHGTLGRKELISLAGKYREHQDPREISKIFDDLFSESYNSWIGSQPVNAAAHVFVRLVNLQPFHDGNKRSANLILNYILLKAGYEPFILNEKNAADYMRIVYPRGEDSEVNEREFRIFLRDQVKTRAEVRKAESKQQAVTGKQGERNGQAAVSSAETDFAALLGLTDGREIEGLVSDVPGLDATLSRMNQNAKLDIKKIGDSIREAGGRIAGFLQGLGSREALAAEVVKPEFAQRVQSELRGVPVDAVDIDVLIVRMQAAASGLQEERVAPILAQKLDTQTVQSFETAVKNIFDSGTTQNQKFAFGFNLTHSFEAEEIAKALEDVVHLFERTIVMTEKGTAVHPKDLKLFPGLRFVSYEKSTAESVLAKVLTQEKKLSDPGVVWNGDLVLTKVGDILNLNVISGRISAIQDPILRRQAYRALAVLFFLRKTHKEEWALLKKDPNAFETFLRKYKLEILTQSFQIKAGGFLSFDADRFVASFDAARALKSAA